MDRMIMSPLRGFEPVVTDICYNYSIPSGLNSSTVKFVNYMQKILPLWGFEPVVTDICYNYSIPSG
ncbi:MAG: hypothetical protein LC117_04665, partial [Bacteroidia bacterium]|nr:hypothetical protein [Bacteroidia bacterium]